MILKLSNFLPRETVQRIAFQFSSVCRRKWQPTPVFLPGESQGGRSLVGYSPWGCEESDTTEWLHFHFSLSCIGSGNGNPFQYSCLENPRERGAWWAAVYGVAQVGPDWCDLAAAASSQQDLSSIQCHKPPSIAFQALCLSYLIPWIYLSLPLYNRKGLI